MYQWTLPSQGLLSQNVEAVCCPAFLALPPQGLNAGARVLPGCCSQVGCRYRSTVSHTGLVDGFPGTSWSRPVKRQIPPDCYSSEGIGFTHVSVTRIWTRHNQRSCVYLEWYSSAFDLKMDLLLIFLVYIHDLALLHDLHTLFPRLRSAGFKFMPSKAWPCGQWVFFNS